MRSAALDGGPSGVDLEVDRGCALPEVGASWLRSSGETAWSVFWHMERLLAILVQAIVDAEGSHFDWPPQ